MPLYQTLNNKHDTRVFVWHITETEAGLRRGINLNKNSLNRLSIMSSSLHRKGFLSIRHLLHAAGYTDQDLYYTDEGKPRLIGEDYISITHSFTFTAIILSKRPVGIDVEMQRVKINKIAVKFIGSEREFVDSSPAPTRALTIIWGAKESMYKLYGKRGLGFKAHCHVRDFELETGTATAAIQYEQDHLKFKVFFHEMMEFTLVYVLPHDE